MKPCIKNRKSIAWLALGALEAEHEPALRAHLKKCVGCREYFAEISRLTSSLETAETKTDLEPSPSFHRALTVRLKAPGKPENAWTWATTVARALFVNWRIALPVTGAFALLLGLSLGSLRHRETLSTLHSSQASFRAEMATYLSPTIANYQLLADHSLDKLDELLTQQGLRNLPEAPLYTASSW
jgi:hypothetical protein